MQIMALSAPAGEEAACYIRFLQQVLPSFLRVTRRLEELQARVQALWPSYNAPLRAGTVQPQEAARLWQLFLPHLHRSCGPSAASRCAPPPLPPICSSSPRLCYMDTDQAMCGEGYILLQKASVREQFPGGISGRENDTVTGPMSLTPFKQV